MPESHRLAGNDTVELQDLAKEAWVVLPGGGAALPNRLNLLGVHGGFKPWIVEVAPDSPTLLLLVGAGLGIAPTLSSILDKVPASAVVYKPLHHDEGPIEVRLMWRRGDPNPALRPSGRWRSRHSRGWPSNHASSNAFSTSTSTFAKPGGSPIAQP